VEIQQGNIATRSSASDVRTPILGRNHLKALIKAVKVRKFALDSADLPINTGVICIVYAFGKFSSATKLLWGRGCSIVSN